MKNFFINNRKKLYNNILDNSIVVLFAGKAPVKRGDEFYPFSPDRNFYYITGIEEENDIIMINKFDNKCDETLYIQRDNGYLAKWIGANVTKDEAFEISGIENIKFIDEFYSDLSSCIFRNNIKKIYFDLEYRDWKNEISPSIKFCKEFKIKYPDIEIINIYDIFSRLREIKEEYEINLIRKAINITRLGIEEMMKNSHSEMKEYEIEAYFDYILTKNGVRQKAFQSIVASGKNSTILHYIKNNSKANDNDLVLCDVGAQVGWYNGDLTRTFPVNGKFTERQKLIYNIVLEGQRKVIEAIKPNVLYSSLNDILKEHYLTELKKIGLVETMEDVSKYYYHSVSHFLGALTHDVGTIKNKYLEKGMIITVEPGLYIEEWQIGIRIEDDVLVTDEGNEVLSKDMIKTIEEIEIFMANNKNGID